MLMDSGGLLGFHSAYQYLHISEGTSYYERYPLASKGTDAVLFTLFGSSTRLCTIKLVMNTITEALMILKNAMKT